MTVIVERDTSLVEMFQSVLGGSTVLESVDQIDEHLQGNPHEYAVILGTSVNAAAAAGLAERFRVIRPSLSVILVRGRVDSAVLAEAMRSGLREVVESRDLTGLSEAVRRAYALSQAMSGNAASGDGGAARGQLITVFSTKGGVGKSTIATNLGAALTDQGRRVCLVDLDVESGDVAIMLQLFPTRSLADLPSMGGGIDPSGVESLLTEHSAGLSVLAAPLHIEAKVPPDAVGNVLQVLKSMFDVVLVDTSGAFDDYALAAFDHSDLLILVGTLDIPALKSLRLATDTLDLLNIPRSHWRLVLNRADANVGLSPKEFEETLGLEIAVSMESSRDVLASVNRGEVIVRSNPRHPVSQSLQALAKSLLDVPATTETKSPSRSHAHEPRRGLLRKKVR